MTPSRLSAWLLHRLTSDAAARAILGDLAEALALRQARGTVTHPGLWLEREAWRYIGGLTAAALRNAITFGYTALRDGWRAMQSSPRTSAFIFAILTLAIATATVTFSVVDAVVIRPLPYDADHDLVVVKGADNDRPDGMRTAAPEFLLWRDHSNAFEALAATRTWGPMPIGDDGTSQPVETMRVTSDLFAVLRAQPFLGRVLTAEDEHEGGDESAVISHALWVERFSADPTIINRLVGTGRSAIRIVGVMPPGFGYPVHLPVRTDVWLPLRFAAEERRLDAPGLMRNYELVGRLREGFTVDSAEADVRTVSLALRQGRPDSYTTWRVDIESLRDSLVGDVEPIMLLALWAVVIMTAIGCVNAANVALTQATARARELALRSALGASRGRLLAGMCVEGLLLSGAASLAALVIGIWAVEAARVSLPEGIALSSGIGLNSRVYVFSLIAAVATGLGFVAAPAWQASRTDLVGLLKDGAISITPGRERWRGVFLAAQLALVTVLLVASMLVAFSFIRIVRADIGFERHGLLSVVNHGLRRTPAEVETLLGALPGVTKIGFISGGSAPLVDAGFAGTQVTRPGRPTEPYAAEYRRVSPTYFEAAGVKMLRGRTFSADEVIANNAIILDEQGARQIFGSVDCVGEPLRLYGAKSDRLVVGVTANVRSAGPEGRSGPQAYIPITDATMAGNLVLRTTGDAGMTIAAIEAIIARESPTTAAYARVQSLDDRFGALTANRRSSALVMTIFAVFALGIGIAGVYGVVSSVVALQAREFGVRIALGATGAQIAGLVFARTARAVGVGAAIGLPIAALLGRASQEALFRTDPLDPVVYGLVLVVLTVAACGAALLPALRAARMNPVTILRAD